MSIYTLEGLKALAKLLDDQIETQALMSQNELAANARVSPNTIRAIRGNRNISQEDFEANRHYEPSLESILNMAPHLIDPLTEQGFGTEGQPSRLEKIVRGWEVLKPVGAKKPSRELEVPNAKAVAFILNAATKDPQSFKRAGLDVNSDEFKRLAEGDVPSFLVMSKLQVALKLKPEGFEELISLYGVSANQSIKPREQNGCKA